MSCEYYQSPPRLPQMNNFGTKRTDAKIKPNDLTKESTHARTVNQKKVESGNSFFFYHHTKLEKDEKFFSHEE